MWGRYCACEILIANPIDWLYAACLEYSIFSRSTVQKLENNMMNFLSIMQTIIYAHDRAHFQGTGWLWFRRMELIEVKSLIWAQKGKLYIIYKNVMWIFGILRFKSIHLLFYTFIHMYISNDSNVIVKYFHFDLLVVSFKSPNFILLMLSNGPPSSIVLAHRWSWDSIR